MFEIGLTLMGIYTLVKGKWPMGKKGYLVGREAKTLGILSLLTIPVVVCCTLITSFIVAVIKGPAILISSPLVVMGIEITFLALWSTPLFILNSRYGKTGRIISKDEPVP